MSLVRRVVNGEIWIKDTNFNPQLSSPIQPFKLKVFKTEEELAQEQYRTLTNLVRRSSRIVNMMMLGGRDAQAFQYLLGEKARKGDPDRIIRKLNVFTQVALAPLNADNSLSFVRDFERILGQDFLEQVDGFSSFDTEAENLVEAVRNHIRAIQNAGGIDIFFLGYGSEADYNSHVSYIRPGSAAGFRDLVGLVPISQRILEHHISRFKTDGTTVSQEDEQRLRKVKYMITLGPAAILSAKMVIQSIIDADPTSEKAHAFRKVHLTRFPEDEEKVAEMVGENPELIARIHPNLKCFALQNLFSS